MKNVIVWDFDGVIADSISECFVNSYWAYHGWDELGSNLFQVKRPIEEQLFRKYRYLVGPAFEYCYLWDTIYDSQNFPDVQFLELYKKRHTKGHNNDSQVFYDEFFSLRRLIQERLTQEWIAFNPIYSDFLSYLGPLFLETNVHYIASTKDEVSILKILNSNDITFSKDKVLGNMFNVDKRIQIKKIIELSGRKAEKLLFIDDNLDHLVKIQALGVRCFMANWGYNTLELQKEAEQKGIKPVTIQEWKKEIANER